MCLISKLLFHCIYRKTSRSVKTHITYNDSSGFMCTLVIGEARLSVLLRVHLMEDVSHKGVL